MNDVDERMELMLGRMVKVIVGSVFATLGTVVIATTFIVRLDARIGMIERDVGKATETLSRMVETQADMKMLKHENSEMRRRIDDLYKRQRKLECRVAGGTGCG